MSLRSGVDRYRRKFAADFEERGRNVKVWNERPTRDSFSTMHNGETEAACRAFYHYVMDMPVECNEPFILTTYTTDCLLQAKAARDSFIKVSLVVRGSKYHGIKFLPPFPNVKKDDDGLRLIQCDRISPENSAIYNFLIIFIS